MADNKLKSQAHKAASKSGGATKKTGSSNSSSGNRKNSASSTTEKPQIPARLISSVIFLALFILFFIIVIESEGLFIVWLDKLVHGLIGNAGFLVSLPVLLYLFTIHAFSGKRPVKMRTICLISFVVLFGCLSALVKVPSYKELAKGFGIVSDLYNRGIQHTSGGLICGLIAVLLQVICGSALPYVIVFVAMILTLLGGFQITIPGIIRAVRERPRAEWENEPVEERPEPASVVVNHIANKRIEHIEKRRKENEAQQEDNKKQPAGRSEAIMSQIDSDVEAPVAASAGTVSEPNEDEILTSPSEYKQDPLQDVFEAIPEEYDFQAQEEESKLIPLMDEPIAPAKPEPVKEKVTAKDAAESAKEVALEIEEAEAVVKPAYCYPPIDLLSIPGKGSVDGTTEMRENSRRLNETLASFKIEAHIINVTRGPSVTRYEVELEKGVRLNKLTNAADDIALSLGASGVRIAAVPGKISVVGIEVPNKAVTTVSLREVIDSSEFNNAKSKSSFAVGKDIGGNCIVGNISKLPHMLIAGTTGSGKSVCMNSIIISILYKASPDDVKLIMVDPKMVELGIYNGIPHLLIPVVTDPKKAAGSLQWAVTEMMRRYKAMSDAGVRDLVSYNSIMESQEEDAQKLPQIVVIIDELADLMLVAAKEVEESICRIAQMGRAAGIHLIIATQRPSADVITGLMKANIPSRIAFAVASAMESRIILDTQGAEKLVGRGDMLFAPIGNGKPKRVQGCFVSDPEVEAVASYVKANYVNDYDQQIMEEIDRKAAQTGKSAQATASDSDPNADEVVGDEMLPAAVEVILETKQASVSMLQRRLKLGYARAARIVDEMEEMGIVGPYQGSKPRSIMITKEQWEAMRSGNGTQLEFDNTVDDNPSVPEDF